MRALVWIVAIASAVLLSTLALAQLSFERRPELAPSEEQSQAAAILARIDAGRATVARQLQAARQARDVVRALCLNDKLSQLDVLRRTAGDRSGALDSAIVRGDRELAAHEYTLLTVLRGRAEQLVSESNRCLGEEMAFIGQTEVTTTIDPNLPPGEGENPTEPPTFPPEVVFPPVAVSPTGGP